MDKKVALKAISEKLKQARDLITECEEIADEADVIFSFDVAYGMGGTYHPPKKKAERPADADDDWEDSDWESSDEDGWVSSSANC